MTETPVSLMASAASVETVAKVIRIAAHEATDQLGWADYTKPEQVIEGAMSLARVVENLAGQVEVLASTVARMAEEVTRR